MRDNELKLFEKISLDDHHLQAVATVLTNLTRGVLLHEITPAKVDSLFERKLSSLNPAVSIKTDSARLNDELRKGVLDYYFYSDIAEAYGDLSSKEKAKLAAPYCGVFVNCAGISAVNDRPAISRRFIE